MTDTENTRAPAPAPVHPPWYDTAAGRYGLAVLFCLGALWLRLLLNPVMGREAPLLTFTAAVALAAARGGLGPGLLATILGMLLGLFFFIPPLYSLALPTAAEGWRLIVFALAGAVISGLSESLRRARREAAAHAARQRAFLKDVLRSVTEGRLRLCDTRAELPGRLPDCGEPVALSEPALAHLRSQVRRAAEAAGFPAEREFDVLSAAGEAAMNAVVHAGGGTARVCADAGRDLLQVWVEDGGAGIAVDSLHRATLERGFTTAGTMGHGFWLMLKTADRIWLLTGPSGTTVVVELWREAGDAADAPSFWLSGGALAAS